MNREVFFDYVKRAPFGGRLTPQQRDGLTKILDKWDQSGLDDNRFLAYMLATVFHETNATMQPIREAGGERYLKSKPYYPWVGNGLVQITWEKNYKLYGLTKPEQAREWPNALRIMFDGMINGRFTGRKLGQYFNQRVDNPTGARAIINGTDKASLIAGYHKNFLDSIQHALETTEEPAEAPPASAPLGLLGDSSVTAVGASVASTVGASFLSAINSPWALGAMAILVLAAAGCLMYYLKIRKEERYVHGI